MERVTILAKQVLSHLSYKPAAYSFHFNHLRTGAHRAFLKYFARAASGENCPLIRDPCEPESRTEAWVPPKVYIRVPRYRSQRRGSRPPTSRHVLAEVLYEKDFALQVINYQYLSQLH